VSGQLHVPAALPRAKNPVRNWQHFVLFLLISHEYVSTSWLLSRWHGASFGLPSNWCLMGI